MIRRVLFVALVVCAAVIAGGCASTPSAAERAAADQTAGGAATGADAAATDQPDWLLQTPDAAGFYYSIGRATGRDEVDVLRAQARREAVAALTLSVRTQVDSRFRAIETQDGAQYVQDVYVRADAAVRGIEFVDEWVGFEEDSIGRRTNNIAVLARLPDQERLWTTQLGNHLTAWRDERPGRFVGDRITLAQAILRDLRSMYTIVAAASTGGSGATRGGTTVTNIELEAELVRWLRGVIGELAPVVEPAQLAAWATPRAPVAVVFAHPTLRADGLSVTVALAGTDIDITATVEDARVELPARVAVPSAMAPSRRRLVVTLPQLPDAAPFELELQLRPARVFLATVDVQPPTAVAVLTEALAATLGAASFAVVESADQADFIGSLTAVFDLPSAAAAGSSVNALAQAQLTLSPARDAAAAAAAAGPRASELSAQTPRIRATARTAEAAVATLARQLAQQLAESLVTTLTR